MLDLKNLGVVELTQTEIVETDGGFLWAVFLVAFVITLGYLAFQ